MIMHAIRIIENFITAMRSFFNNPHGMHSHCRSPRVPLILKTFFFLSMNYVTAVFSISCARTLVNLVPSPLVSLSMSMDNVQVPWTCNLSRPIECSCFFGPTYSKHRNLYRQRERAFVKIMERVSYMPEFHSDQFTVVYQPFFGDASVFLDGQTAKADLNIMSVDCVHFSQRGHAVSANGLWNNMLEPIAAKSRGLKKIFSDFRCPSAKRPYISTYFNE